MAQTLCIKCGSELKASSYCQLCQQPLIFKCTSCEYVTEEKFILIVEMQGGSGKSTVPIKYYTTTLPCKKVHVQIFVLHVIKDH